MAEFHVNPNAQFVGAAILPLLDGFGIFEDEAVAILAKHGLKDLKADQWYAGTAVMASLKEICEKFGDNLAYQMGRAIPGQAALPPGLSTVEKLLGALNVGYQMNVRGDNAKGFQSQIIQPGLAKVVVERGGTCHLDRGMLAEFLKKLAPSSSVAHDDSAPCRRKGSSSCTYIVKW